MICEVRSTEARNAISKTRSLVLIDGVELAALMIEHGVGVTHKERRIPKVDSDYFEEF